MASLALISGDESIGNFERDRRFMAGFGVGVKFYLTEENNSFTPGFIYHPEQLNWIVSILVILAV